MVISKVGITVLHEVNRMWQLSFNNLYLKTAESIVFLKRGVNTQKHIEHFIITSRTELDAEKICFFFASNVLVTLTLLFRYHSFFLTHKTRQKQETGGGDRSWTKIGTEVYSKNSIFDDITSSRSHLSF
jgi:hypothetical protein